MSLLSPGFNTGTYAVTRYTQGALTSGVAGDPTVQSTFNVNACVQPMSGRNLKDLPEGRRSEDFRVVFTDQPLLTDGPGQLADQIVIGSSTYRVNQVKHFTVLSGHRRVIVERLDVP